MVIVWLVSPGAEGQSPRGGLVVGADVRRAVGGGVVHRHGLAEAAGAGDGDRGRASTLTDGGGRSGELDRCRFVVVEDREGDRCRIAERHARAAWPRSG